MSLPPALLLLAACADPGDTAAPGDTVEEVVPVGAFAILTDTHVGETIADYGTEGWDDAGGDPYDLTARLDEAVAAVNAAAQTEDIRFVAVLGDLTDSGETSEMTVARDALRNLTVPWVPLLGNHDLWPYACATDPCDESPVPDGDQRMREVYADDLAALAGTLEGFATVADVVTDPDDGGERWFWNHAFEAMGFHFVALDLASRAHAEAPDPGAYPGADPFDREGGTWAWFEAYLAGLEAPSRVIALSHHPLAEIPHMSLDEEEMARVRATFEALPEGVEVPAAFAGHMHLNLENADALPGTMVVLTSATKDGTGVRVVRLWSDGSLDWDTRL